jgi:putative glutamine amidotransferase
MDSLEQGWIVFLESCGITPLLIPNSLNDPLDFIIHYDIQGLILTGGNNISDSVKMIKGRYLGSLPHDMDDLAKERDITETNLLCYFIERNLPVLGVCRGMQLINVVYGGSISKINDHAGTTHKIQRVHKNSREFSLPFDDVVNSFHNYGILTDNLNQDFNILAQVNNVVEAIVHKKQNIVGIMWHPERNVNISVNDIDLFRNIFKIG